MRILAIDPGTERSAWLSFDTSRGLEEVVAFGIQPNAELAEWLRFGGTGFDERSTVVIEKVESFGMAVGAEVFETVYWSGRFAEAARPARVERIGRRAIKVALCGSARANDANIRAALLDRFGGRAAVGTKAAPGPLYGIAKDVWSALAVAVVYADQSAGVAA